MSESSSSPDPQATAAGRHDSTQPGPRHETNTVRAQPFVLFGGILMLLIILVFVIIRGMFGAWSRNLAQSEPPPSPLRAVRQPPPQPLLQVHPHQDLTEVQAREDAILHSYGWVDQANGVVRLPIDRAMLLLIDRGLPVHPKE